MPGTKNRNHQPPANARVRRQEHQQRDAVVKARKRARRARGAEDEAYRRTLNTEVVSIDASDVSWTTSSVPIDNPCGDLLLRAPKPYRAPDVKAVGKGWQILDADDNVVDHAPSRDKARARAKEKTASGDFYAIGGSS